jgi:hypothetical protein
VGFTGFLLGHGDGSWKVWMGVRLSGDSVYNSSRSSKKEIELRFRPAR